MSKITCFTLLTRKGIFSFSLSLFRSLFIQSCSVPNGFVLCSFAIYFFFFKLLLFFSQTDRKWQKSLSLTLTEPEWEPKVCFILYTAP